MVLAAPGKSPAATIRRIFALSYDLWEERFAVTAVDARSQSVSHLVLAAAEAWCVEQLAIPLNALGALGRDLPFWIGSSTAFWMATAPRSGGLGLHAAGAHRRVESPPQDGVVAARARGGSVQTADPRLVLAAMTLRSRLIAAFLASTLLPLGATVWITTAPRPQPPVRDNGRARSTLPHAREHREAVLSAGTRCVEAGRARGPDAPDDYVMSNVGEWPESIRSFWESGEPEGFAVRGQRRARGLHAARGQSGRSAWRRDLQPRPGRRQHGTTVHPGSRNAPPRGRDRCATCGGDSR